MIRAGARDRADARRKRVRGRPASDPARAVIAIAVVLQREVRIVEPGVVPADLLRVHLNRARVLLERRQVDLAPRAYEIADRVRRVVSGRGPVPRHVVVHLRVGVERERRRDVCPAAKRRALPRQRARWNESAGAPAVERDAIVLLRASLLGRREGRQRRTASEEVGDVVRTREPGTDVSEPRNREARLSERLPLKWRAPVLCDAVVRPAAQAVEEGELAVEPLTIRVLKCGNPERGLARCVLARRYLESRQTRAAARRDQDDAVRRPAAPDRRSRTTQHLHRRNLGRLDALNRRAVVETSGSEVLTGNDEARVLERHAVEHEQRLSVAEDRVIATQDRQRRSASGGGAGHVEAHHSSRERAYEVSGSSQLVERGAVDGGAYGNDRHPLARRRSVGVDRLNRRAARVANRKQLEVVRQRSAGKGDRKADGIVTDVPRLERDRLSANARRPNDEGEPALGVRGRADAQLADPDRRPLHRQAVRRDVTRDRLGLLSKGAWREVVGRRRQRQRQGKGTPIADEPHEISNCPGTIESRPISGRSPQGLSARSTVTTD